MMKKSRIKHLFSEFANSEKTGGFILILCTVLSLFLANGSFGDHYVHFWHRRLDLSVCIIQLDYSIQHWINDGLMTVFFLLVGLEIERELYAGELASPRKASLPVIAALGGMIVPAAIHYLLNRGSATQSGVGIPMATDIAFALGALSLLGSRVPVSLKIFLTAFAIMDDLGAIIIIGAVYSKNISYTYLLAAVLIFTVLLILNRFRVYRIAPYLILGAVMWYCMLKSGVHATITGVLLAFAVPFVDDHRNPSGRLQHHLHKPVAYLILPVFAAANTGIVINEGSFSSLLSHNSLGILLGLLMGKPLGIVSFSLVAVYFKVCRLPRAITWNHITGAGILGGIGFTMSIFISNLAFDDIALVQNSIVAVLMASIASGAAGLLFLRAAVAKGHSDR